MAEYCFGFVEDAPSAELLKRLIVHTNNESEHEYRFREGFPSIKGGAGNIRKKIDAYSSMAKNGQRVLVLVDLDSTECPLSLLHEWFSIDKGSDVQLPELLMFRIAIREIESWVMADRFNLAKFLGIPIGNFHSNPDGLPHPKSHLLDIIRRKGKKKRHTEMLPKGKSASIGPRYNELMCEFVQKHWNPEQAAVNSPSLARAILALKRGK